MGSQAVCLIHEEKQKDESISTKKVSLTVGHTEWVTAV